MICPGLLKSAKLLYMLITQHCSDPGEIKQCLEEDMANLKKWLDYNKLTLNIKKTKFKQFSGVKEKKKHSVQQLYSSSFSDYFSFNQNPIINISQFYQGVQKYWSHVQTAETFIAKEIFNQIIWNIRYITIKNKPFEWKKWVMKG